MTNFASATMKKQIEQKLLKFDDSVLKSFEAFVCFEGDCDNFDSECGKSLTQAMCTSSRELMAKKCPKMCSLCGKLA